MDVLYERIKKRRIELGLTQSELAERVGYSGKSMIAKIERGSVNLGHDKITVFAKALNTTSEYLTGYTDTPYDVEEFASDSGIAIPDDADVDDLDDFISNTKKAELEAEQDDSTGHYYIDDEAREYARFLFENPEYKVLFKAARDVKKEDLEFVKNLLDRIKNEQED